MRDSMSHSNLSPRVNTVRRALLAVLFGAGVASCAAESVTITFGGKATHCEVLKFLKGKNDEMQMQLKLDFGEQTLPLRVFSKQDVHKCYDVLTAKPAALRLDMAQYFYAHEEFSDARIEAVAAAVAEPKLKTQSDALLQKIENNANLSKVASAPKVEAPKAEPPPPAATEKPAEPEKVAGGDKPKRSIIKIGEDGKITMIKGDDYSDEMSADDFAKKMMHAEVPPKSDKEMKDWLDQRLAALNKLGGKWRMIETKHFYCFANIDETKHKKIANEWNEDLYKLLCDVLRHKEGDRLWNNKMPIYYFDTYKLFQSFAVEIDRSPGAQFSGGYFSARGRDVHICIPFMSERYQGKKLDETAHSTLYHEGTHAFLQLTGEDVKINRWLHEGMAQFIEFYYEDPKSQSRRERVSMLQQFSRKNIRTWSEMEDRPGAGTDIEGYAYAWSRAMFLYQYPDVAALPNMVKLIKAGKTEKEAIETTFKHSLAQLEAMYDNWLPGAIRAGFPLAEHH